MRTRSLKAAAFALLVVAGAACGDENPFRSIPDLVIEGNSQLWELGLEGFPSGFDIPSGQRFFVGPSSVITSFGTFVLEARDDGTLVFRSFATLTPAFSVVRVGIQDLGARPFEAVTEVPDEGYASVSDTLGVPVVEGHTYAFRISIPSQGLVLINYAKLHVIEVEEQVPGDPGSRFIRFEYAYQNQPLNRNVAVGTGGP